MAGAPGQWACLLTASLTLAGCTMGLDKWRNEQAKAKDAVQHMRTEQQERDNYAACLNRGALPGTAENLACQLELAKKEQQAAKPPSPATKPP